MTSPIQGRVSNVKGGSKAHQFIPVGSGEIVVLPS